MTEFFVEQALKEAIDLHQRNQLDDAKSIYTKIITHDKDNSDAYHLLSLIYLVENNLMTQEDILLMRLNCNQMFLFTIATMEIYYIKVIILNLQFKNIKEQLS